MIKRKLSKWLLGIGAIALLVSSGCGKAASSTPEKVEKETVSLTSNEEEYYMSNGISRRTFLMGAAAAGVAIAAGTYFSWNGKNIPEEVKKGDVTYDVLVIGSGGAGMRAALAAAENKGLKVAVMTKLQPTRSASTMAQGGMNGVTKVTDKEDSVESHMFDTIKGGDYLCDQDAVEYFAENAGRNQCERYHFPPGKVYPLSQAGTLCPDSGGRARNPARLHCGV